MATKKRDPLLALGGSRIAAAVWLQEEEREGGKHHLAARAFLLTASSCATFAVIVFSVAKFFHRAPMSTLFVAAQFFAFGLLLSAVWQQERWHPWLGRFISAAAFVGVLVGLNLYYGQLVYYYHYQSASVQSNVAPSQGSALFGDVGMLGFTSDTRLDTSRSVGYQDPDSGEVLCVAPIVDGMTSATSPIALFAAGANCCSWRSHFRCGAAMDAQANSALMYLAAEQLVNPFMAWSVQDDQLIEGFKRAAKLQASVFDTVVSDSPRFVRWTRDPRTEVDAYLRRAVAQGAVAGVAFLVASFAAALVVAAGRRRLFRLLYKHLDYEPDPGGRGGRFDGAAAGPPPGA